MHVSRIGISTDFIITYGQASLRRPATAVRSNFAQIFLDFFLFLFGNYRDFIVPASPSVGGHSPRPGGRARSVHVLYLPRRVLIWGGCHNSRTFGPHRCVVYVAYDVLQFFKKKHLPLPVGFKVAL